MLKTVKRQKMTPHGRNLLVLRDKPEEKTAGGLHLHIDTVGKLNTGTVIALGSQVVAAAVGDQVMFGPYVGTELELNGEEHVLLREDEIQGHYEEWEEEIEVEDEPEGDEDETEDQESLLVAP